jgi:hypothetical protein
MASAVSKLVFRRPQTIRRPTPAEMGDEVTIAVVALTAPHGYFVSVSDQMISHDDILPADDSAIIKTLQIAGNWSVAYSANKIENVLPLLDKVRAKLKETVEADELQHHFAASISDMIQRDFFNRPLLATVTVMQTNFASTDKRNSATIFSIYAAN